MIEESEPGQYADGKMVNHFGFLSTPEITISKPKSKYRERSCRKIPQDGGAAHLALVGLNNMGSRWQKFIKRFHPEGIPWPGSVLYNALSSTTIFLRHYELVAHDIAHYGTAQCLLDIGTGPGHLLFALRKTLPEAELVGIDLSPAMIAQAQRNVRKNRSSTYIELRVAAANALPFADRVFDRVVSTGSLHHWDDPVSALSEAYRVLKVGGYALMYDLVRNMPKAVCEDVRARFGRFRLAFLWLHSFEEPFLNVKEMDALGRQTDFTVEGTKFAGALCCLVLKKTVDSARTKDKEGQPMDAGDSQ